MSEALKAMAGAMLAELRRQDPGAEIHARASDGKLAIDGDGYDLELVARAGLVAIREPTAEMVNAWYAAGLYDSDHPATGYTAMVDGALAP